MKRLILAAVLSLSILILAAYGPVVSDVQVEPQVGRVLISYRLAHPDNATCDVSVEVSSDGGASYAINPSALIGDIGVVQATAAGNDYQIIWHPRVDEMPLGNNYAVRVIADDHEIPLLEIALNITQGPPGTMLNLSTSQPLTDADGYNIRFGDAELTLIGDGSPDRFMAMVPILPPGPIVISIYLNGTPVTYGVDFSILPPPETGMAPGQLTSLLLDDYCYIFQTLIGDFLPNLQQSGILTVGDNLILQDRISLLSGYMASVNQIIADMSIEERTTFDQLMLTSEIYTQTKQYRHNLERSAAIINGMMGKTNYSMNAVLLALDGMSAILTALSRAIAIAGAVCALPSFGMSAAAATIISSVITLLDSFIDTYLPTDIDKLYVAGGQYPQMIQVPLNGYTPIIMMGRFVSQTSPSTTSVQLAIWAWCNGMGYPALFNVIASIATNIGISISDDLSIALDDWHAQNYYEYPVNPLFYNAGISDLSDQMEDLIGFVMPVNNWLSFLALLTGVEYDTEEYGIASYNSYTHELHGNGEGYTYLVYNIFTFKKHISWWNLIGMELPYNLDNEDIYPCQIVVAPAPVNQIYVTSTPSGADIYLNGQYAAQTPASVNVSYNGLHTIQLFKQGYNDYYAEVTTTPGGCYNLHAVLTQAGYPLPVITLTSPGNNDTYYGDDVNVSGSIFLEDSQGNLFNFNGNQAILQINESNQTISVVNNHFHEELSLNAGTYQISVRCNTENGVTGISETVTVFMSDTVAPPQFFPPATTYDGPQNIYMECATQGAQIYYTTDGSDPNQSSQLYQDPIYIASTTTLKARAYKQGVNPSAITSGTYTISAPSNFIYVPGGTFTMGNTHGSGSSDELPTHTVTLNSYYIGKYEVTQAEYSQYMQPGSSWTSNYGLGGNYPAYYVSWYAILKYCNLRSMAEGLTPVYSISGSTNPANWGSVPTSNNSTWNSAICNWYANGYRLPTEAEWEYAARGRTNSPDYLYSGSNDINAVAWYYGNNSPYGSKPIGTKAPNGIGTYDMSGNLWEWCWDWYSSSYYSSSPQNNPTGPNSGSYRLLRGGDWADGAAYCRVADRGNGGPYYGNYVGGFRLCRAIN